MLRSALLLPKPEAPKLLKGTLVSQVMFLFAFFGLEVLFEGLIRLAVARDKQAVAARFERHAALEPAAAHLSRDSGSGRLRHVAIRRGMERQGEAEIRVPKSASHSPPYTPPPLPLPPRQAMAILQAGSAQVGELFFPKFG